MVALFVFSLTPFPNYDFYSVIKGWYGNNILKYIVLKPQDMASQWAANSGIISVMYLILFFASIQARVFSEGRHIRNERKGLVIQQPKMANENTDETEREMERNMSPPQLIRHYQKKERSMIVRLPVYTDRRDFTVKSNPRNYLDEIRLLLIYRFFNKIPLIILFIDAAIDPGFIKLIQMAICIIYLSQVNRIYWYTRYFWIGIGIFYYILTFILALYQIPIVIVGDPGTKWGNQAWTAPLMMFFGLTAMSSPGRIVLSVLVFASYYIQDRIFLTTDYIFFVNCLVNERERRRNQQARNRAFLAAQLVKRFAERSYLKKRRDMNMKALKEYQELQSTDSGSDRHFLKNMYR